MVAMAYDAMPPDLSRDPTTGRAADTARRRHLAEQHRFGAGPTYEALREPGAGADLDQTLGAYGRVRRRHRQGGRRRRDAAHGHSRAEAG
jgi:hypothetical protein